MDTTHNAGTFLRLLEWFSEAQLLSPNTRNNNEVVCLLYDSHKKHILWNYAFDLFKGDIHNMNITLYGYFHTYTEAKSAFILGEEIKASKINRISKTKKSKDNISGAANSGNIKNKESKNKKKDQQSNTRSRANKNSSSKCTYCRQDGHFATKCFKKIQG